jgi:hypothetical protein
MAGLPTGGDGGSWIKYSAKNTWQIATGNSARVTVTDRTTTIANDLSVTPGKFHADALSASAGGGIAVTGNLYVTDTLVADALSASVGAGGNVAVSGNVRVTDSLRIVGGTAILDNLSASAGDISLTGTLRVTDRVTLDDLSASVGNVSLTGNLRITDSLTVDDLSASVGEATVSLTGNLKVLDDVDAAGGFRSAFIFSAPAVKQGEMTTMSSSIISGSEWATRYPMPSNGSVLRVALYSDDSNVTAGTGLTASVTVDGVQAAVQVIITTGSAAAGTAVAKDTATFSASQQLGVVLTASSGYLSSLAESGSFLASVLVEM